MLRTKLILTILFSVATLIAVLFFLSTQVLLNSYEKLETAQTLQNLERVDFSIKDYSNTLKIKLVDWSQWDDTYAFIQGQREEYIDSNLADETLINLEINLMAFVDTQGTVVFSKFLDPTTTVELPSEAMVREILTYDAYTDATSEISGMIKLEEGVLILEGAPIYRTDGSGPSAGTMFFGRILDTDFVNNIEQLTRLDVDIFSQNALPEDVYQAQRNLNRGQAYIIRTIADDNNAGYFHIRDLNNTEIATVRILTPRTIAHQGQSTITIYGLISTGAILAFGILIFILFEYLLLRRLARISTEVDRISVTNLTKAKISDRGNDELGKLAQNFNTLLEELSETQKKEDDAIRAEVIANEKLKKSLKATEEMNKLMIGRELRMAELKEKVSKLELENRELQQGKR